MISVWFSAFVAAVALLLGAVVVARAPRHAAHLSFGLGMMAMAVEVVICAFGGRTNLSEADLVLASKLRLLALTLFPAPWVVFSLCYSRGDHREMLQRWKAALALLAIAPPAFAFAFWDRLAVPGILPSTLAKGARLAWAGYTLEVLLLLTGVLVLTNLERTFRHVIGIMRWRTKYVFLGTGALAGFRIYAGSQAILYGYADTMLGSAAAGALVVACALLCLALVRTRIFDVDVYPSQAFVFGSLTVLITGAYLVTVGLVSYLLGLLSVATHLPVKTLGVTVALVGLAIVLLSEQLRQRLRLFINRHLHRPSFDYRQVWSAFTQRTRSLIDEEVFCRAVTHWVSETFSTLAVSLWCFDSAKERLTLGGSTSVPTSTSAPTPPGPCSPDELARALRDQRSPVNIDASKDAWAETLRGLQPSVFPNGGNRVAIALHAGEDLLGILIIGDRVGGVPFSAEDFDLLKCAADQIASGLLGLQLSRQRAQSKELEAFQTMSAFFVHDLKNTASTLSLTLRNLQQHFSDPAFREDALRAVGKSVQHLNDLIARLTRLRQEWRVQTTPGSLKAVIDAALVAAGQDPKVRVTQQFADVPPVLVDAAQMEKVIVNLIMNARDAMPEGGSIQVTTTRQDPWGIIGVSDQGCGMSPEFVRKSLFRPFQTTKRNGLGIGMFHSKTIVDAHGGRMEVDTAPGRGTTVRVFVPLAPIS
jgi:putative PEP-CTERM system histidine kinase